MSAATPTTHGPESKWLALFGAAAAIGAFHALCILLLGRTPLELGSLNLPKPGYVVVAAYWAICGGLATALAGRFAAENAESRNAVASFFEWLNRPAGHGFIAAASVTAVVVAWLLRSFLLAGAPLADDESAYLFAARLLATGRLWTDSPPLKEFFDQNFMINDGRLYPVYFLGWPALLSLGVMAHVPGLVNPVLSGLTVLPLSRILHRVAGANWVKSGVIIFLTAPMIQVSAATLLSHTACLMALTWCLASFLQATDSEASWRHHSSFAFFAALAFCIRPQSTLALAAPLGASWLFTWWHMDKAAKPAAVVAFAIPTIAVALLFLAALASQNGSPWVYGYARYNAYIVANQFKHTTFGPADLSAVAGFDFSNVLLGVVHTSSGLLRLNFDLFGWASSLALTVAAAPRESREIRLLWWMVASFLAMMFFQRDWGIDTFGPLHAFELSLPVLILTTVGAKSLGQMKSVGGSGATAPSGQALITVLAVVACVGFTAVRLTAVHRIARHINIALQAPERGQLSDAVVFAPFPFAPPCPQVPNHFVFFHPTNDPDLKSDVLWVNDLGDEANRRLLATTSGRTGYVLEWTADCQVRLRELQPVDPRAEVPSDG